MAGANSIHRPRTHRRSAEWARLNILWRSNVVAIGLLPRGQMRRSAAAVEMVVFFCCTYYLPELDMKTFLRAVLALAAIQVWASALASDRDPYPVPHPGAGKGRIAAGVIWNRVYPVYTPTAAYPHRWGEIKDSRGTTPSIKDAPVWTIDLDPPGYTSRINEPRTAVLPASRIGPSTGGIIPAEMASPKSMRIERERTTDSPHDFTWKQNAGIRTASPPQANRSLRFNAHAPTVTH